MHDRYADLDGPALMGMVTAMATSSETGLRETTRISDAYRWSRAERWMATHGLVPPYGSDDLLALIAAHQGHAYGTLRTTAAVVSRMCRHEYGADPRGAEVKAFLRSYANVFGRRVTPVPAIRAETCRQLVAAAPDVHGLFVAARLSVMMLVSAGAWTRGGETTAISVEGLPWDALVSDTVSFGVRLDSTKSDANGETAVLELVPSLEGLMRPAMAVYQAAAAGEGIDLSTGPAFPSLTDPARSVSLGSYQRQLRMVGDSIGLARTATHGFRRAGATSAAEANMASAMICRRGRWRTELGPVGYIELDPFDPQLQVDYPMLR